MKKVIVIISVLLVLFVSCGSGPNPASSEASGGGTMRPMAAAGTSQPGQVPVEVKEIVMFGNGSVDEYITFEYDPSYNKLVGQGRYSASNAVLEQVEFTYEDKGYLTAKSIRDVENKLKNRVAYQYDSQGKLKQETLVNKSGKAVSIYDYTYDENGNCVSRVMNSGLNQRMAETRYTYNAQGKVTGSETRDAGGSRIISSIKNTYDNSGHLVKQEVFNGSGQVTSVVNAVWQNGLELKNEQVGSDGKVQMRITNEYGSHNELLKRTIEDFQGASKQITQYEYVFRPASR